MIECLILGDSIAVGTKVEMPQCISYAKGGFNSRQWMDGNIDKSPFIANKVIISLGTNDHKSIKTEEELRTLRLLTKADQVYWIMPAIKPNIQALILQIALEHNDIVIPIHGLQADKIHPSWAGYKDIVKKVNEK
jgi:lysophospholipase L1-like esterase